MPEEFFLPSESSIEGDYPDAYEELSLPRSSEPEPPDQRLARALGGQIQPRIRLPEPLRQAAERIHSVKTIPIPVDARVEVSEELDLAEEAIRRFGSPIVADVIEKMQER